jgi:hypothetical protein
MSQGPPSKLKEFISNSGVQVTQARGVAAAPPRTTSQNTDNVGEFAQFLKSNSNNNTNFYNIVNDEPLKLKIFNARVDNIVRPDDVFKFMRNITLSPENQNGVKIVEVSAHYGRMKKGLSRSINFNYVPKLDPQLKVQNVAWTYVQFKLTLDNDVGVIAKVYKNFMLLQGSFSRNDENTPHRVANFIISKFLGGEESMMNKTLTFTFVEGEFRIPKKFNAAAMNKYLRQRHGFVKKNVGGIRTKVDPFMDEYKYYGNANTENERKLAKLSKNAFYEFTRYKEPVIQSISGAGVVKLTSDTISGIRGAYATARKIVDDYFLRNNAPTENANTPKPKPKRKRPTNVINKSKVNAAIINITIGVKKCGDYSASEIKAICKGLGIPIGKKKIGQRANGTPVMKQMDKKDLCLEVHKVLNVRRARLVEPGDVNLRNLDMYKKRGIDNASIRNMLKNEKSLNVNADLQKVKNKFTSLKSNKEGVPFKKGVQNAVKNVVKERKVNVYAMSVLNRYKLNAPTRNKIIQRVKNVGTRTQQTANAIIKRDVAIARLNVSSAMKNKIYNELKTKTNVNVGAYAKLHKLIDNFVMQRAYRRFEEIKKESHNWLKSRNTLPTTDAVERKVSAIIKNYDAIKMMRKNNSSR